jgi:hypothetical protein
LTPTFRNVISLCLSAVRREAEVDLYPSAENYFGRSGKKKLPAARTANPRDFMDARFIQELDKSGYIDGLYR